MSAESSHSNTTSASGRKAPEKKRTAPTEDQLKTNFEGWNEPYSYFSFVPSNERIDRQPAIECEVCKVQYSFPTGMTHAAVIFFACMFLSCAQCSSVAMRLQYCIVDTTTFIVRRHRVLVYPESVPPMAGIRANSRWKGTFPSA